jgi:GMP synthase (glutamine-hydrolysing)
VRPFLLLSSRAEDEAADDEYAAFLRLTGLDEHQLRRHRLEAGPLPRLDLDTWSGLLLGGGPFCSSDPETGKSAVQQRVERELRALLDEVVARDFPFLGACYGIGTLGVHQGGVVDRTYAEPIGAVRVHLTPEGRADPLLEGLPPSAVLLAGSAGCPVQMFRVKRNLYATQFHPELDHLGLVTRIRVYRYAGYFRPEEMDVLIERVRTAVVTQPPRILAAFVARYAG